MKSLTAVCQTGASMPAMKPTGRIARHPRHTRPDGEDAEMKMYLSKLKDLVPFMPKRKLSKLEIIQHVIDYICDLQTELEAHPEIGNFDAATALNITNHLNLQNHDEDMLTPTERLAAEAFHQHHQQQQLNQNNHHQYHHQQSQSQSASSQSSNTSNPTIRQPLADRQAPNTILPPSPTTAAVAAAAAASSSPTLTSASILTTTYLSSSTTSNSSSSPSSSSSSSSNLTKPTSVSA